MAKKRAYVSELTCNYFKSFNHAPVLLWADKAYRIFDYIGGKADYYHPSVAEISNNLNIGRSTVGRKLKWLESYNILRVHRPSQNRVKYTINPPSEWDIERLVLDGNVDRRALVHGDYFDEGTDSRGVRELVLAGLGVDDTDSLGDSGCSTLTRNKRSKESKNTLSSSKDNKQRTASEEENRSASMEKDEEFSETGCGEEVPHDNEIFNLLNSKLSDEKLQAQYSANGVVPIYDCLFQNGYSEQDVDDNVVAIVDFLQSRGIRVRSESVKGLKKFNYNPWKSPGA